MVNERKKQTPVFYYPLRKRGKKFAAVAPDADMLRSAYELESQLEHNFDQIVANVEMSGQVRTSPIWIPKSGKGYSYIAVDGDRAPFTTEVLLAPDLDDLGDLKESLRSLVARGEFGSPGDSISLETQFVPPTFTLVESIDPSEEKTLEWSGIRQFSHAVITGPPGAGKTSCLRRLAMEAIEELEQEDSQAPIPIYFQLRSLRDSQFDVNSLSRIIANLGAVKIASMASELASSGQLFLILDGLDEVEDESRLQLLNCLTAFAESYPKVRMIVSTRDVGFEGRLEGFTHLEIKEWSLSQISRYTCYRLPSLRSSRKFLSAMKGTEGVKDLVSNPLILTIAIELFTKFSTLPTRRTTLFEAFIDSLISQWDFSRNVVRRRDEWASPRKKWSFLTELAFHSCKDTKVRFDHNNIKLWMPWADEAADVYDLLEVSRQHTGILRRSSTNEWSFSHKSIQEFLAAKYLVTSLSDFSSVATYLEKSPSWQEVWRYSCSLTSESHRLLGELHDNRHVPDDVKIFLLSSALAENVELDKSSGIRYCTEIGRAVEKKMAHCRILDEDNEDSESEVWKLKIDFADREPNVSIPMLSKIFQSLFMIRGSIWSADLATVFLSSKHSSLKRVGRGLSTEGTLRTVANRETPTLLLEVVRELQTFREYGV